MIFDKHRFEIWTLAQHPLKHTLSDFAYANPALPGVSDINSAFNWIVKVLYPNAKATVADPASLPLVGNTLNDYRVVQDDGDGKQAGYRWEQREGEVSASWHKVFDFDWSTDSILAAFQDVTQDLYVYQKGKSDLDVSGNVVTAIFAGQTVHGGNLSGQNLTLRANSGDGVGAHTGFVQVDDNFRATLTGTYDVGTSAIKFKDLWISGIANAGTLALASGSITDSSGAISFGNENLTTTGNFNAVNGVFSGTVGAGTLALGSGSITDSSGAISFGNENLTTTGTLFAGVGSKLADITFANGSITSLSAAINFGSNNLITTGSISCGALTATSFAIGNLSFSGNTISVTNLNGNLVLSANGTGIVDVQHAMTTLGITTTGIITVTGQLNVDNLRLDANVISSQNLNGNITLSPNGSGVLEFSSSVNPTSNNAFDLGSSALKFKDLYLAGNISDGTTVVTRSTLQSLRDINVGVAAGMALFYDGTKWVASNPDTEITHNTLSGLTTSDAGHTQFVMLAGRVGGQSIIGGTAASENLTLESTSNAAKGSVLTKDHFRPFTNASYSGSWSGTDLGGSGNYFRDVYTKGEFKGLRLENYTSGSLPSSSAQNIGRLAFAMDNNKIYVDTGAAWVVAGISKFVSDTTWDGVQTTQDFTVSASIQDARNAIWALHNNANDFDRIYCSIKAISATQVRVTVSPALPAGSFRLIGME
jgi:hypothetical protein